MSLRGLQWYQHRVRWTLPDGGLFSFHDESFFPVTYWWTHQSIDAEGSVCTPNNMQQVDRFDGGCVMVWTGINHGGRTVLVHMVQVL